MIDAIVARLMADYAARRQENEREEARRMEEIRARHPDLAALVEERHSMILSSVRSAFGGPCPDDPEQAMDDYNRRITSLLESKGYPQDYLAPVYQCARCRDTGYVYEHALRVPCACLKDAYQRALAEQNAADRADETFERFDESRFPDTPLPGSDVSQRKYMRIVRDKCQQYADGIPESGTLNLLLHGGSGLGKTFLLNCVGHAARGRGVDAVSVTAYDLLADLKAAFFSRDGAAPDVYFQAPLLRIDDLGMEPLLEGVTVEQIYNLLNSRMNRRLYTAFTTNLNLTEMGKRYTERFSSRLLDTRVSIAIPFMGRDIRLLKQG